MPDLFDHAMHERMDSEARGWGWTTKDTILSVNKLSEKTELIP